MIWGEIERSTCHGFHRRIPDSSILCPTPHLAQSYINFLYIVPSDMRYIIVRTHIYIYWRWSILGYTTHSALPFTTLDRRATKTYKGRLCGDPSSSRRSWHEDDLPLIVEDQGWTHRRHWIFARLDVVARWGRDSVVVVGTGGREVVHVIVEYYPRPSPTYFSTEAKEYVRTSVIRE